MAFIDVIAVIAYVPGGMQKRCRYSLYIVEPGDGRQWRVTGILLIQWYERER